MNFFCRKKKETNYGKIVAITLSVVAGVAAVAYILFKLYEKYVACKALAADDDFCDEYCCCGDDDVDCEICNDEEAPPETEEAKETEAETKE